MFVIKNTSELNYVYDDKKEREKNFLKNYRSQAIDFQLCYE
jgi:hypothetical protein